MPDLGRDCNPVAGVQTDVYTYPSSSNKLGSISFGAGGNRAFTYDKAGNITSDNRAAVGYTYNAAGRMSEFTASGVLKASYKYDFEGRQAIIALCGGITIHSVFDSQGNRIDEYSAAKGDLIREYVWMLRAPLAVIGALIQPCPRRWVLAGIIDVQMRNWFFIDQQKLSRRALALLSNRRRQGQGSR